MAVLFLNNALFFKFGDFLRDLSSKVKWNAACLLGYWCDRVVNMELNLRVLQFADAVEECRELCISSFLICC